MTRSEYSANQALANTPQGTMSWAKPAPVRVKLSRPWWRKLFGL